jgi:MoaA/NifB/PqqE/SkfB family radical SAM enzyme
MCDVGQKVDSQFYQNMVKPQELSVPDWIGFIDGLMVDYKDVARPTIAITSAEPLLYDNLFAVVWHCTNNGFPVQLTTNGFLLPKYYKEILTTCVRDLYVSVDGTRDVHNDIRGNLRSWDNLMDGLNLIKNSEDFKKSGYPKIFINYTISDKNYFDLVNFMESISGIPYAGVTFSHMNFITSDMARLHNKRYAEYPATETCVSTAVFENIDIDYLWKEIETVRTKYKNVFFSPPMFSGVELKKFYFNPTEYVARYRECTIPWRAAQIFSNGDVGVSTRCFNMTFGNITNRAFSDIWFGKEIESFRKSISETKNGSFPACTRCCGVFS